MSAVLDKLHEWMEDNEDEHLEFKEAKNITVLFFCRSGGLNVQMQKRSL